MISISYTAVGIAGISISVILVLITTWRVVAHYSGHSCPCSRSSESDQPRIVEGWTLKRGMHEALWLTMIASLMAYITILSGQQMSGMLLLQSVDRAFGEWWVMSLITISWLQHMAGARACYAERKLIFKIHPTMLVCLGIGLAVFSAKAEAHLLIHGELNVPVNYITIMEAVAWLYHGIAALHGSIMRFWRLRNLPQWQSVNCLERFFIAGNWFVVIGVTGLFFVLRSVVFASSIIFDWDDNTLTYWICGVWLPTVIPSLLYLFLLRRRDRVMGWSEGITDPNLLAPSAPPEEAFQAFRDNLVRWDTDNPETEEEYLFNSKLEETHSSFIGYVYKSASELGIYDSTRDIGAEDDLLANEFSTDI